MAKTHKSHQKILLSVSVIALILAFGLLASTWSQKSTPVSKLLQTITTRVDGTYSNLAVSNTNWPAQMGSALALHDMQYNFSVSSQSMPSLYLTMKEGAINPGSKLIFASSPAEAASVIDKAVEKAGFSIDPNNNKLPFVMYGRDNTTCLEKYDAEQLSLTFSCYDKAQIGQVSAAYQTFVTAYNKANNAKPINLTGSIGPITIKSQSKSGVIGASNTPGYDIAEAVVSFAGVKKLALFYNKDGGSWTYITQANDEYGFSCQDYTANAEVRAAMHKQICLGDSGQVRLDSTERALQ